MYLFILDYLCIINIILIIIKLWIIDIMLQKKLLYNNTKYEMPTRRYILIFFVYDYKPIHIFLRDCETTNGDIYGCY